MEPKIAVLLMAYGSPRNLDEVEPYFTDILAGRVPSPKALQELAGRYQAIGGASQLNQITGRQAAGVAQLLERRLPGRFEVLVGMKHWHPYISESVSQIQSMEISEAVGLVLAPHYSKKSIGEYESRILKAQVDLGWQLNLHMVDHWYEEPAFVELVAANLNEALEGWDRSDGATRVFFTAHSIPARIIAEGDPYAVELTDSASVFAKAAGIGDFQTGWQSASATNEPWLGPDILEELEDFRDSGGRRALIAPVGFVSDHLEVLFDVDIECVEKAKELGIELRRIASPNDDPRLIRALADVAMRYSGV
ncbi:MAG: ferrochelatase [Actinomycetota bacterium]